MVSNNCIKKALEAAGDLAGNFTEKDMKELLQQLEGKIKNQLESGQRSVGNAMKTAQQMADQLAFEGALKKRQEIINIMANRYRQDIFAQLPKDPALALEAMNVGINTPIKGGRNSVDARQKEAHAQFLGTAMSELRKAGVLEFFQTADEAMERMIGREMQELNFKTGKPGVTGNPEALKIAKVLNDVSESARVLQNDAGAYIAKRQGWVAPQSHDMVKLARAKFQKWYDAIMPKLAKETFDDVEDVGEFMKQAYGELSNGLHYIVDAAEVEGTGPLFGNRAAKASAHRVFQFKSFDDWFDYNKQFGSGSLKEAVVNGWGKAAKNIGIMQVWGTNPKDAFANTLNQLKSKALNDKKQYNRLNSGAMQNQFDVIDGTANIPGNVTMAQWGQGIRAVNTMAKLGASTVSALSDPAMMGAEMRYQTGSFLRGHQLALEARLMAVPEHLRAETTDLIGVGIDGLLGNTLSRFDSADGVMGTMTKSMNLFFKLNLQTWWDDSARRGFGMVMAREMALKAGTEFEALGKDFSRVLQLYDIGKNEWDLLRKQVKQAEDGRGYITPDVARNISDADMAKYLGGNPTDGQIRRGRAELEQKTRMYFLDRSDYAIIRPGARERAIMYQGLKPGTPMGEIARLFWQFKSFSTGFITKAWGRETFGRETSKAKGAIMGIAPMVLTTSALGYLAMLTKDLIKGKDPRDPRNFGTWQAALLQGGGLGIYGDFIFGDYNRFGKSFWSTALGPTAGNVEDVAKLWAAARTGDDVAAKTLRFVQGNLPFANLFYLRPALDYMLLYDLQEAVSPGSLRRMERNMQTQNKQQFYLAPSQDRLRPFTQ